MINLGAECKKVKFQMLHYASFPQYNGTRFQFLLYIVTSSIVRWDYTVCHPLDESTIDDSTLKVRFPVMTVFPFPSWPHFPFQHGDIFPYPITRPTRPLQLADPPPANSTPVNLTHIFPIHKQYTRAHVIYTRVSG